MLLNGGSLDGARILRPETVALMNDNQIGDLPAGILRSCQPERSNHVDFFPGACLRWGLGYMLNLDPGPNGRSAGTVSWAGIFNTYYWLDPSRRVAGVIMTQILPFADRKAVALYGAFERAVYAAVDAG
jgi:CubicO group peptidase (beta-lactamase class C family)